MKWFGRKHTQPGPPDPDQVVTEMLDEYHPRASIVDGDKVIIEPGKVLENIAFAMERIDNDINTPISIEENVVSLNELVPMIREMRMGPLLAAHVVNNAVRIMSARYPSDLVRRPLPPEYDLRKLAPLKTITDQQHETAKVIFNRRTASPVDLTSSDIPELEGLDWVDQNQIFATLFYMFGSKVGALKYSTGIK